MAQYQTQQGGAPQGGAPPGGAPPGGAPPGGAQQAPPQNAPWYGNVSPQEREQIAAWFTQVDADRSGQIDANELGRALALGGMQMDPAALGRIIAAFDTDRGGTIGVNEFVAMHKFLTHMRDTFYYFDQDRSGFLDLGELYNALTRSGYQISTQSFYAFCPKFDTQRAGRVSLSQYLDMCVWLANMRQLWGFYDPYNRGTIQLTFDQLLATAPYFG